MIVAGFLSFLNPVHWAKSLSGDALHEVVSWVQAGAKAAIEEVAHVIGETTTPQLTSTWFSAAYWRVAGLATLLTVPFLFAAALQAMIRSDLALLARAVFGYLPLALIGVGIAAPITMLLLSATDEMSNLVSGLAVGGASHFLTQAAEAFVLSGGDLFIEFAVAMIATAAALALALEMMVRAAAVYVIVLMLPMVFAALVWPARRLWAVRLVELLVALIVSKFVIVAVLSLAGAAFGQSGTSSVTRALTAMSLLLLSTFAPWTMLKLLPFTEVAASAGAALRQEVPRRPRVQQGSAAGGEMAAPAQLGQFAQTTSSSSAAAVDAVDLVANRLRTQAADAATLGSSERRNSTATGTGAGGSTPTGAGGGSDATTFSMPGVDGDRSASSDGQSAENAAPVSPESEERLPGMDSIWQAENGAWPPLNLGPGGWGGPTKYVPPGDSGASAEGGSATPPTTPAGDAPPTTPAGDTPPTTPAGDTPPTTPAGDVPPTADAASPEPTPAPAAQPDPSSTPVATPDAPALTEAPLEQVPADVPNRPTPDDIIDPEITTHGTTEP